MSLSTQPPASLQSTLLSKMNERQVLQTIQLHGPMSRAEVARRSGISAPTASKAVESLLRAGLLEEGDAPEMARGRPARKLNLPTKTAQVLGLVLDAETCRLVAAGLDGQLDAERDFAFPTPPTYAELLDAAETLAQRLMNRPGVATLGLGITLPGLMDYRRMRGILSPNLPITNQQSPMQDLTRRLGVPCVLWQESHALCLAELRYGNAKELDDFAMMDVATGVGLGVMSGGRLLTGHSGLAGEIGHLTVVPDGRRCGCGNFGCLETVACDSALAWEISQQLGRRVTMDELIALIKQGDWRPTEALENVCRYLAIGIAAVLNLLNPSTLFLHGRMFDADPTLFARLLCETERRALRPSLEDCRIVLARGSKRQGAIAGIIEHLMNSVLPRHAEERGYGAMPAAPFASGAK